MAAPAAYSRRSYVGNAAATTVPLGLGSADGSCTIASATNWPSGSGGNFLVVIDRGQNTEELAWSSGVSGTTLTFSARGAQGTSGVAHSAGCSIALAMGQQDLDESNQVVSAVLGQSGAAKGDIPVILGAAGPVTMTRVPIGTSTQVLGVSAGLPAWETPANGYGIAGFAAHPMTPAVSLTSASGNIPSNIVINVGTPAVIMDTASLGIGTWLINMIVTATSGASTIWEITAAVDTATASLTGVLSAGSTAVSSEVSLSVSFVAVVTVAGTIKLTGQSYTNAGTVLQLTGSGSKANATGYTAIRIA